MIPEFPKTFCSFSIFSKSYIPRSRRIWSVEKFQAIYLSASGNVCTSLVNQLPNIFIDAYKKLCKLKSPVLVQSVIVIRTIKSLSIAIILRTARTFAAYRITQNYASRFGLGYQMGLFSTGCPRISIGLKLITYITTSLIANISQMSQHVVCRVYHI